MIKKLLLLLVLGVFVFAVQPARADLITFDIGLPNTALSPYTGPYASVAVDRTDSTTATITFTSLTNSGNIYLFGDGGTVDVNVHATSWTIGSFFASNAGTGFTPGPLSDGGSGNVSSFGTFNQTINSFDGWQHSSDTISFVLTNTSGGAGWGSAGDVLVANAIGNTAAAHIFVASIPANAANGAIVTGFATNGNPNVPDGGTTVTLLGSALLGLGLLRRRLGKR